MFWSVLIYPPLSTNIDVEKKHRVDHFPRDGLPGLPLRGPGCGKWWNPVDLHRASESIWWNPSNCKGIRWRRLPISSRHAVFIYIYISILIRIDGGIYPYPYQYIYIYIYTSMCIPVYYILTLYVSATSSWWKVSCRGNRVPDTVLFFIKDGYWWWNHIRRNGMESFVNKDGVSRGFANEIQGLEPL